MRQIIALYNVFCPRRNLSYQQLPPELAPEFPPELPPELAPEFPPELALEFPPEFPPELLQYRVLNQRLWDCCITNLF